MKVVNFWNSKKIPKRKALPRMKLMKMSKNKPKLSAKWFFGDADRDGVYNGLDCQPFNRKKQGWAHRGHQMNRERSTYIRMMSPDKFLRTTYKESMDKTRRNMPEAVEKYMRSQEEYERNVTDRANVERLKKVIKTSKGKMEVPFLEYDRQGRPTGHEGRHRAIAARELGAKRIPVTIARELDEPRDWKNMRKAWKYKKTKHDYRNDLENVDDIVSSKSADISIKEQRRYGEERPEVLERYDEPVEYDTQEIIEEVDTNGKEKD